MVLNVVFGSTILCITTFIFLFIAHIRFPASGSHICGLRNGCGRNLVKKVRTLEKLYHKLNVSAPSGQ